MRRILILGALAVAWITSGTSIAQKKIDLTGSCKPSEVPGCTRDWDAKTFQCKLSCKSVPFAGLPFTGLPIVVAGPLPDTPTGPATPGTNRMDTTRLLELIKRGTTTQRAQVADWLATPTISHALGSESKPLAEQSLSPEILEILKTIREGTEKDRSAVAEKLFKGAK